jgi:hypothetical protein
MSDNSITTPAPAADPGHRRAEFEQHLARIAEGGPTAICDRMCELDREWTAGRLAKATAGVLILVGLPLAFLVSPWFAVIPAVGGLFLAQYAFTRQSWLNRLFQSAGYRTGAEIDEERFALKALRGDFKNLPTVHDIEDRDAITRLEGEGGMVVDPDESKVDPQEAAQRVVQATHQ